MTSVLIKSGKLVPHFHSFCLVFCLLIEHPRKIVGEYNVTRESRSGHLEIGALTSRQSWPSHCLRSQRQK